MLLSNAGAIPLPFQWHVANELDPGAKELTILPVKGVVLPYANQTVRVEFQPQAVQKYSLQLVMDMPGVADAAATLSITAECAVPLISLAQEDKLLQFGEVYLRHPYSRNFSLVNQSKLPAKFEVLAQVREGKKARGITQSVPGTYALHHVMHLPQLLNSNSCVCHSASRCSASADPSACCMAYAACRTSKVSVLDL
jgi:hypothetical protein